jgi:hypothetical protein
LQPGDAVQARFTQLDSDVPFVGWVAENCESEKMVVLELPNGYVPRGI